VGDDRDTLVRVPFNYLVAEGRYAGGELSECLTVGGAVLRVPDQQSGSSQNNFHLLRPHLKLGET
jgi:hypothetical protein